MNILLPVSNFPFGRDPRWPHAPRCE